MKKHEKRSKDPATVTPMFARYLTGPSLKTVTGGLVVNQKYPNSCTFDDDYDYPGD